MYPINSNSRPIQPPSNNDSTKNQNQDNKIKKRQKDIVKISKNKIENKDTVNISKNKTENKNTVNYSKIGTFKKTYMQVKEFLKNLEN